MVELLGAADIRALADSLGVAPTKKLGQNFVTDPNTIRRIVQAAKLTGSETVVEIGPGLGSLTLGLLEQAENVIAVEIDNKMAAAIEATEFSMPICAVYQNVNASAVTDPQTIKDNLVAQLTAPVKWTQIMQNMIADGASEVIEVGPGKVLQGLFKKVDRAFPCSSAEI
jgi:16S rRNA A1518/A1519 N6-dimethyltransferase RsmA/KsgA/DIM1 with predicted DNA glycosylase/AP lyase activity